MNYLALDLGSKTIGLATSKGTIASPGPTIRFEEWEFNQAVAKLNEYLTGKAFDKIIIGYPLNMDGSVGERADMVDYFLELFLENNHDYQESQIEKVDERRTTKMAKGILIEAGMRRNKQKEKKDSLAAQLILEQYLASH